MEEQQPDEWGPEWGPPGKPGLFDSSAFWCLIIVAAVVVTIYDRRVGFDHLFDGILGSQPAIAAADRGKPWEGKYYVDEDGRLVPFSNESPPAIMVAGGLPPEIQWRAINGDRMAVPEWDSKRLLEIMGGEQLKNQKPLPEDPRQFRQP